MKPDGAAPNFKVALGTLVVGALGAPIVHIAEGIIAPQGFVNFRGDSIVALPFIFLIAWAWSLIATLVIGGVAWLPLHKARWDGFLSYLLVAVIACVAISFGGSGRSPSWELLLMATANALIARLSELRFRTIWRDSTPRAARSS